MIMVIHNEKSNGMTLYGRLSNDSQENSNEIRRLYRFRESTTPTEQSTLPFIVNGLT